MEIFLILLYITSFLFGILSIILFFKIWGMTNNVSNISKFILDKNNCPEWDIRKYALKGDKAGIENILYNCFIEDLSNIFFMESNYFEIELEKMKRKYKQYFEKFNIEYPQKIAEIKTKEDVVSIFEF